MAEFGSVPLRPDTVTFYPPAGWGAYLLATHALFCSVPPPRHTATHAAHPGCLTTHARIPFTSLLHIHLTSPLSPRQVVRSSIQQYYLAIICVLVFSVLPHWPCLAHAVIRAARQQQLAAASLPTGSRIIILISFLLILCLPSSHTCATIGLKVLVHFLPGCRRSQHRPR